MSVRPPTVRRITFIPSTGIIYTTRIRAVDGTSFCLANSSCGLCLMMFVFLRPELCRQLPSDSTSRWTPLLLANGWQLPAPITDLHRLVMRHAWRTKKTAASPEDCGGDHIEGCEKVAYFTSSKSTSVTLSEALPLSEEEAPGLACWPPAKS